MDMVVLLGVVCGMRSMTAMAVLCWAAWLGYIPEHGWAVWVSYLVVAILFTLCALGEYVADTLPKTPNRTAPGPAIARIVLGMLVGALVAMAIHEPLAGGVLLGAVGAVLGTWASFWIRMTLSRWTRHDLPVALVESASAIALAILALNKLHGGILMDMQRMAWR